MKILIENGVYHLRNMGDVAMMQVLAARMHRQWPEATIEILTREPKKLRYFCPDAQPLDINGRKIWFHGPKLFGEKLYNIAPRPVSRRLAELDREVRYQWPTFAHAVLKSHLKRRGQDQRDLSSFFHTVSEAALVVLSGCGGLTDSFFSTANSFLDMIEMAVRAGIPTALVGQGIGPVTRSKLYDRMKDILPQVDLIAIRERRKGPEWLEALGVDPARIWVTGDDAIELAYSTARPSELGTALGINLRVSPYSDVVGQLLALVRDTLQQAGAKYGAELRPVPISFHEKEADMESIRKLLNGHLGSSTEDLALADPQQLIKQVQQCRVVVTGSYHAAVFALSQGIPAVCLSKSDYYNDKFWGLADQFGIGCTVVSLTDQRLAEKLSHAIDSAWESAQAVRQPLLAAAARQIEAGHAAYQRIYDIVSARQAMVGARKRASIGS
jgi:colanic acid/amylovoran biosynthesis protein